MLEPFGWASDISSAACLWPGCWELTDALRLAGVVGDKNLFWSFANDFVFVCVPAVCMCVCNKQLVNWSRRLVN